MVRLLSLRIRNLRGVRSLDLPLDGANGAILGPNGSGKSSVVDAFDFLVTGRIERLTGQGTGSVSLGRHGPHLQAKAKTAAVEGDFLCDGLAAPFTIRRCIDDPDGLESVTAGDLPADLSSYLSLAQSTRLHLLTRRQILAFVLAEPSKRSELVGSLLRTEEIDALRKELQGASKLAVDEITGVMASKLVQQKALLRSFSPPLLSHEDLLGRVNDHRIFLGAKAIADLSPSAILRDVAPLAQAAANPLQSQRTKDALASAISWDKEGQAVWLESCEAYLADVVEFRADSSRVRTLRALRLVQSGQELVEGEFCPLCLRDWDRNELLTLLAERIEAGKEALTRSAEMDSQRDELLRTRSAIAVSLEVLASILKVSHSASAQAIEEYAEALKKFADTGLPRATDDSSPQRDAVETALAAVKDGAALHDELDALARMEAQLPDLGGAQKSWDELSAAARQLSEFELLTLRESAARATAMQLEIAHQSLIHARDEVLQEVYDAIAARFDRYYSAVHAHDDDSFSASLTPTKAGLKLEVGFHGLGEFPPAAVHSEGHQDSMGLCLFLALVAHLNTAAAGPLVLDDVVMSVDRDHRRGIAKLLASEFLSTQFILTTHDRVWWHQLRTVGLVKSTGLMSFPTWTLENGPTSSVGENAQLADARTALESGNVAGSAHAVRHTFEMLGPSICDSLAAPLRFRSDGGWTAGEYMDAAIGRFSKLLKKARSAAHSWKQGMDAIEKREAAFAEANKVLGGERWAVNAMVHFNEWADLSPADFAPVLAAHEALFAELSCSNCDGLLALVEDDGEDSALRCPCGSVSLNLVPKGK